MGNKAPTATPRSVYVFYGHGSNEVCIKPGVVDNVSLKHQTVAEYTTLTMPENVIVVGVGIIGEANYPSLQEAFRIVAGKSPEILLDPVQNKELIESTLNHKMIEVRKNFSELPEPKLYINDGRLFQKTFNFAGNVFTYDEASDGDPENVDKSGLYSLDALRKDTKPIYGRLIGSNNTSSSFVPSSEQLKALFYATDDSGKKIAGSEAFYPSQHELDTLISSNDPTTTLNNWSTIFNTIPTTLEMPRLFDHALRNPGQLHIFYLPACRSPYESTLRPLTRSIEPAKIRAATLAQEINAGQTNRARRISKVAANYKRQKNLKTLAGRWRIFDFLKKKKGGSRKKKHSLTQNNRRLTRKRR
jgi:hypothetical protein